ncbi:MAG: peroxiredoxin-like family protein [Desulfuromonadaceae bacterium]
MKAIATENTNPEGYMKYMRSMMLLSIILTAALFVCGTARAGVDTVTGVKAVPAKAEEVQPILVGQVFPKALLKGIDGTAMDLSALLTEKPSILIFYRGGWCKYCNEQLSQLQALVPEFDRLGFQLLAISPDSPEQLKKTAEKLQLGYRLLSDNDANLIRKLGIAFQLDDATVSKYKNEYKVDLEGASGQKHHQLPVPSAFVIDRSSLIHLAYVNPNYKIRIDPDVLLAAARSLLKQVAAEQSKAK